MSENNAASKISDSNVLTWLIEKARQLKEFIAILFALGATAVASVNYFVTREELKIINCQIMGIIAMHDDQLTASALSMEIVKLNINLDKLSTITAPDITQILQENKTAKSTLEGQLAAINKVVEGKRKSLERGECHMRGYIKNTNESAAKTE